MQQLSLMLLVTPTQVWVLLTHFRYKFLHPQVLWHKIAFKLLPEICGENEFLTREMYKYTFTFKKQQIPNFVQSALNDLKSFSSDTVYSNYAAWQNPIFVLSYLHLHFLYGTKWHHYSSTQYNTLGHFGIVIVLQEWSLASDILQWMEIIFSFVKI